MFGLLQNLIINPQFKTEVKNHIILLETHQKIVEQGKVHLSFYLINKGKLRVIINPGKQGSIHPSIAELGPGDIFGEFSLFDDGPANADVIAVTPSELVEIDKKSFLNYLEKNTEVGYLILTEMLKTLTKRLRNADKTILCLYTWGLKAHQLDKHLESE